MQTDSARVIDGSLIRRTIALPIVILGFVLSPTSPLMRPALIIGIVLILAGGFVLVNGGSFTSRRDVLKVGDLKVSADQEQSVPTWLAGAIVIAGVALVATGVRRKA